MKNRSLRDEVNVLLKNKSTFVKMYKGEVGNRPSVEIETIEPKSVSSVLYSSETDRDADLVEAETLLK